MSKATIRRTREKESYGGNTSKPTCCAAAWCTEVRFSLFFPWSQSSQMTFIKGLFRNTRHLTLNNLKEKLRQVLHPFRGRNKIILRCDMNYAGEKKKKKKKCISIPRCAMIRFSFNRTTRSSFLTFLFVVTIICIRSFPLLQGFSFS